jgi:DNA-binding PadR family transcriptional regulator
MNRLVRIELYSKCVMSNQRRNDAKNPYADHGNARFDLHFLSPGCVPIVVTGKPEKDTYGTVFCLRRSDIFRIVELMRDSLGNCELMVLLAVLRLDDGAYGVPIVKELERSGGRIAVATVYAALDRLEEKGLVTSAVGDPTAARGGRAKRYFRLTGKGVREVKSAQRVLTSLWQGLPVLKGTTP